MERWLVSYADFITLLFAFFVVMYALSQSDAAKFSKVAASLRAAFAAGPVGMVDLGGTSGGNTVNPFEIVDFAGGRVMNLPAGKTNTASDADPGLQEVKELLEEAVSLDVGTADSDQLQMQYDDEGLTVRLTAKDFFDEGEVAPRMDLRPVLDKIGEVIHLAQVRETQAGRSPRLIRIVGHTDLAEARNPKYPSDWLLSQARAAWLVQYWVQRFNFSSKIFEAAGCAHFRPLTESRDVWGRAKNRRVEIVLLKNRFQSPPPSQPQSQSQ